jgi:hypothetical protein
MPCSRINMPGGGVAIVKHAAARYPRCKFCQGRLERMGRGLHDGSLIEKATLLCDFEVGKTLGGDPITCDAPVCAKCATRVGDKDFCPKHRSR